ncbi:TonB-dependent receptor [uncultured Draconibacterium sp.]|uniref:SusC/RagA family TonB-linked outer membrane protein n=1 Tax=uncultured Draconibacterium sp. TaxID=1573823 RepID=UPI003217DD88
MRLNLLLTVLFVNLFVFGSRAQSAKISLSLQNAPLQKFISEIEEQSDYYFIYQDEVFDDEQLITIKVQNVTLEIILFELEKQTSLSAELIGYQVILKRKDKQQEPLPASNKRIINGRVVNEFGIPLPGVAITMKGTLFGTLSNSNGLFELTAPKKPVVLVFSFVGLGTKEILVTSEKELHVVLTSKVISIEEVVAVGYGTVKKTENTGSIASIKTKLLKDFPVTTIEQGLKGHVAGVQITQNSGQPGAGMSVRIRGVSSIAGGNEPLYVIDGIPTFNSDVRELNGLSGISPGDISSVEVLKDAIATAIYGSRAANGVILITTQKGNSGKMQVTYDSYLEIQNVRKKLPLMSGDEYISYANEYYSNARNISEVQRQQNLTAINNYGNANTDWQDEVFRTAYHHGQNITFSGGGSNNQYYASLNYVRQNGIVENTDFTRFGFRLNLERDITNWLSINGRTSFSKVIQNGFLAGDGTNSRNNQKSGIGATLLVPSTIGVYDENGDFSSVLAYPFSYDVMDNPVAMLQALDRNTMYYFIGGFDVDTKLASWISNTTRLGMEYTNRIHDYYLPSNLQQLGAQTAELDDIKILGNIFEDFFTINKTLGEKLSFEAIGGFSAQWEDYQSISLAGTGFPSDDLLNNSIQAATSVSTPVINRTKTTLASFFSRIHMAYHNKYLMSLSIRYDGSSVFSESDKWATFPAVALAWRIGEEDFLKNTKISNLKLRSSWGLSGNQAIKPYQSLFVGEIVNTGQGAGSGINVGLAPTLPNKNLSWETTEQYNLGIDYGMYNERFRLVFDYYVRNTRDLLANVTLPGSAGYSTYVDNVGAVQNKGFELSLGADLVNRKDWLFAFNFNFSKNNNVVVATKNNQDIIPVSTDNATRTQAIVRVGEPIFSFYLPKYLGLDENGKPMYDDVNKDGIIDDADSQVAGSSLPDFFYGLDISLQYKNLALTMNWQGVYGAKLNNVNMMTLTDPEPIANRIQNIRDYYPLVSDDYIVWDSDRFIEDASFFRLKNIKLEYKIPGISNVIDDVTLYISGQNILTFTKYSGFEPEVNSFSNENQLQGVDYAAFPSAKTVTLGVNVKF